MVLGAIDFNHDVVTLYWCGQRIDPPATLTPISGGAMKTAGGRHWAPAAYRQPTPPDELIQPISTAP